MSQLIKSDGPCMYPVCPAGVEIYREETCQTVTVRDKTNEEL